MSIFTTTYILTIIIPLYAQLDDPTEIGVCQFCNSPTACPTAAPDGESCQQIGVIDPICYWNSDNPDVGSLFGINRICENDYHCASFIDGTDIPPQFENVANLKINACLRCCEGLCVETVSEELNCGSIDAFLELVGVYSSTNTQVYAHGFNWAPCCPGQVCFDNTLGVCGVEAGECEQCVSWNTQTVDFIDSTQKIDNCAANLTCLTNEVPSATVEFEDFIYLAGTSITNRRRFQGFEEESVFLSNLRPRVTVQEGICVAADGVSISVTSCETDDDCPKCMRCCDDIDNSGNKQCVRSSGDICGLNFEGRGPCCCGEYTCCSNECVTKSPSKSPTDAPSKSTPAPNDDDDDDDDSKSDSDEQQFFGAEQMLGDKNNDNDNEIGTLSEKFDILIGLVIVLVIILVIGIGALTIILCKKKGQASFTHDTNSTINENV